MATKVVMPPLGDSSDEAKVLRWLKQVGDSVQKGDTLLEIETDKATVEIDAYGAGVLRKILVPEGETVAVGVTLGVIAAADEDISSYG
jgi:pyruvate/2-oxoglutarate dehydrogenase complex dihydrolipoamide acyltransferase (E2) component